MSKPEALRVADMQELIKRLAVEAGAKPWSGYLNNKADMNFLDRFAQAVARECAGIVEAKSVSSYRATELAANAIRARFGIEGE